MRWRTWLLPPVLRGAAVFVALAAAGLLTLTVAGHYDSTARWVVLVVIGVVALALTLIPGRAKRPTPLSSMEPPGPGPSPIRLGAGRVPAPRGVDTEVVPPLPELDEDALIFDFEATLPPRGLPDEPVFDALPPRPEPLTEPVPPFRTYDEPLYDEPLYDPPLYDHVIEFDDMDFEALKFSTAGVGFDELIPSREPSDLVRQYLFPTEQFRGEWRPHWIRLARELIVIVALALLVQSGYSAHLASYDVNLADIPHAQLISQLALIILVGWRGMAWYVNRFVLTNKRLILIKGVLWRRTATLPLLRAVDIIYRASPLGRVLHYGAFRFTGASFLHPLWRVANLPHPTDLYLQVVEEMYEPEAAIARRRPARVDDRL
jgi:hypothetical protein